MRRFIIPRDYQSKLSLLETEKAIKMINDYFEASLANNLGLTRVSAPLFVCPESGLNDYLNGFEKAVSFEVNDLGRELEIVQSLAKWKRSAIGKYDLDGIYTDMNAIRRDEELDNLHSIYVDQWDWELRLTASQRNDSFLREVVRKIYGALISTEEMINVKYPLLGRKLPDEIHFISSEELYQLYPEKPSKEREDEIAKKYKAVFISQIGWPLSSGIPHDGRAPDYDDWNLNGDIIVWSSVLETSMELSSMGTRVDKDSLQKQIESRLDFDRLNNPYCKGIIEGKFPYTIGGGIGQSRLCQFLLEKAHIGEVQVSVWSEEDIETLNKASIILL